MAEGTIQAAASEAVPAISNRLLCLDAFRGFDMFWIVGAENIVHAMRKISDRGWIRLLADQMDHKEWEGFAFYDLIFPTFVFIAGVSIVYSLGRLVEQEERATAYRRVVTRGALLYAVGIFYYGGIMKGVDHIRLLGVLQRIALSYTFAALLFCTFRLRGLAIAFAALLLGYWALMTFVPVPDVGAGNFAEGKNLANYIDKQYLPLRKWDGDHDPEGLLSTLPAIGTCLMGVFAGYLLKDARLGQQRKFFYLVAGGVASVALGWLWGLQFPVIKKIWTSSYVLVAGGYSALLLAAFYQVIEIWGFSAWALPFVWIGMNPITVYLAHNIVDFDELALRFAGGPIKESAGVYGELLVTTVIMALTFLLVRFMYNRKIFLRI